MAPACLTRSVWCLTIPCGSRTIGASAIANPRCRRGGEDLRTDLPLTRHAPNISYRLTARQRDRMNAGCTPSPRAAPVPSVRERFEALNDGEERRDILVRAFRQSFNIVPTAERAFRRQRAKTQGKPSCSAGHAPRLCGLPLAPTPASFEQRHPIVAGPPEHQQQPRRVRGNAHFPSAPGAPVREDLTCR